jgi:hypothetical protein
MMPPCHTGEEACGKRDDVLLVVQKEGTDRFHFAKPIPLLRNGERKEAPVRCGWTARAYAAFFKWWKAKRSSGSLAE